MTDLGIMTINEQSETLDSFLKAWQDKGTTGWKMADLSDIHYKDNKSTFINNFKALKQLVC